MSKYQNLTDSELSHQLSETRIALQSIRPYFCREIETKRRELWAEYKRRQKLKEQRADAPACSCGGAK